MNNDWKRSEDKTAKIFGKKTAGSGAGLEKLDIKGAGVFSGIRIENKYTEKDSYSLNIKTLKKGMSQALSMMSSFLMVIDFGSHNKRFVVIEEDEFLKLVGYDS